MLLEVSKALEAEGAAAGRTRGAEAAQQGGWATVPRV